MTNEENKARLVALSGEELHELFMVYTKSMADRLIATMSDEEKIESEKYAHKIAAFLDDNARNITITATAHFISMYSMLSVLKNSVEEPKSKDNTDPDQHTKH